MNDTQEGVLNMVFKIADESGLLLLDLKDLRSMLQYVADNADQFKTQYGNVSAASAGAIQRSLLELETQGADKFFGEPALDLDDLIQTQSGRGVVNILAAEKLMQQSPKVYATFLLWLLSELFERLPEIGDPEKPKLVFFFDEAHLLFTDIEPAVEQKIEQMVRLIRSKGVGVYFVSQNPLDIPDVVLGPARESRAACLARLHAARSKGGVGRGANVPAKSEAESRDGADGAGRGRSARLDARRRRQTGDRRSREDRSAAQPGRRDHAGATEADHPIIEHCRAITRRRSIANRPTKNCRRGRGQSRRPPARRRRRAPARPVPAKRSASRRFSTRSAVFQADDRAARRRS